MKLAVAFRKSLLIAGLIFAASAANAGLVSVSQQGLDVTVSWAFTGTQRVNFNYKADFTNADSEWVGATADAFSVQFGSVGGEATLIDSIAGTATSANAAGSWQGFQDKVTGNGCSAGTADAACYTVLLSGEGGDGAQIIAKQIYDWNFYIDFLAGIDVKAALAQLGSIKFLALKQNRNGQWSTAAQMSQSATVPEPGTLSLLGAALFALGYRMRRKQKS
ncbi:MAG: PEP-CTERM sorting domain-containing protein [Pseudomonadales bacterium]